MALPTLVMVPVTVSVTTPISEGARPVREDPSISVRGVPSYIFSALAVVTVRGAGVTVSVPSVSLMV